MRKKTDFFDDDLIQQRDAVKEVKIGSANEPPAEKKIPKSETVPVQELNLTAMTKRKEEINSQVATKLDELERLQTRQTSLEREKNALEQLRNDQEKYEGGKREMIDHLEQSLVSLEREEILLNQRLELLVGTEKGFKEMESELRSFREEEWPADSNKFRDELAKALAIVENIRKEYHKSLSRLEAVREVKESRKKDILAELSGESVPQRSFVEWLMVGFAVSLPLVLVLVVLVVVLVIKYPFIY